MACRFLFEQDSVIDGVLRFALLSVSFRYVIPCMLFTQECRNPKLHCVLALSLANVIVVATVPVGLSMSKLDQNLTVFDSTERFASRASSVRPCLRPPFTHSLTTYSLLHCRTERVLHSIVACRVILEIRGQVTSKAHSDFVITVPALNIREPEILEIRRTVVASPSASSHKVGPKHDR
jgi:hypothetical protein